MVERREPIEFRDGREIGEHDVREVDRWLAFIDALMVNHASAPAVDAVEWASLRSNARSVLCELRGRMRRMIDLRPRSLICGDSIFEATAKGGDEVALEMSANDHKGNMKTVAACLSPAERRALMELLGGFDGGKDEGAT